MATAAFDSEDLLVESLLAGLGKQDNPWGPLKFSREFNYTSGRTDVIAVTESGFVMAFEAKLTKWRCALDQAYRNRCFADISFVVLPREAAVRAASCSAEFVRRGVGICYVSDDDGLVVMEQAEPTQPVLPWLREVAIDRLLEPSSE